MSEEVTTRRPGSLDPLGSTHRVLAALPDGVFTVDLEGRLTYWNPAMEALTGFTADQVLGRPCSVIRGDTCFVGQGTPGPRAPCNLFSRGAMWRTRCRIHRADGTAVPILKNGALLYGDDGQLIGGIETVTDLGEPMAPDDPLAPLELACQAPPCRWGLVGQHASMAQLFERITLASKSRASVLLLGETGTGKELVAKAIHDESDRAKGPFVRVSCAALSETLLESELFGHVRGAFSGAVQDRVGRFEAAHGGTLFLDEIGDISPAVQVKLLRVLQDHQFERVGSNRAIWADFRVIAATNQPLERRVDEGRFRSDLYYRLAVFPIHAPPLRERKSDLPLLADHLLRRLGGHCGVPIAALSPEALADLHARSWPGNIRELEHALEYAAALAGGGTIEPGHLPPIAEPAVASREAPPTRRAGRPTAPEIQGALRAVGGNRESAARNLGVSRMTLWRWMKDLGLSLS